MQHSCSWWFDLLPSSTRLSVLFGQNIPHFTTLPIPIYMLKSPLWGKRRNEATTTKEIEINGKELYLGYRRQIEHGNRIYSMKIERTGRLFSVFLSILMWFFGFCVEDE